MRHFTIISKHTNVTIVCDHLAIDGSFVTFHDSAGSVVAVAPHDAIVVEKGL